MGVKEGPPGRALESRLDQRRRCLQDPLKDKHKFITPRNGTFYNPSKPKQSRCKGMESWKYAAHSGFHPTNE